MAGALRGPAVQHHPEDVQEEGCQDGFNSRVRLDLSETHVGVKVALWSLGGGKASPWGGLTGRDGPSMWLPPRELKPWMGPPRAPWSSHCHAFLGKGEV